MLSYVNDRYKVGNEEYIDTMNPEEIFPKNDPRYAKDSYDQEYYPRIDDEPIFLTDPQTKLKIYCKDAEGNELYPFNYETGAQIAIEHNGITVYAKYSDKNPYYPYDELGNPCYPINETTGAQSYTLFDQVGKPIYGVDRDGIQRYAKNARGDEIYPPRVSSFARDMEEGEVYNVYAKTHDDRVVYPVDEQDSEFYLKDPWGGDLVTSPRKDVEFDRYARKKDGHEIYPTKTFVFNNVDLKYEIVLNQTYAIKEDGMAMYPLDANGNEYVLLPQDSSSDVSDGIPRDASTTLHHTSVLQKVGKVT